MFFFTSRLCREGHANTLFPGQNSQEISTVNQYGDSELVGRSIFNTAGSFEHWSTISAFKEIYQICGVSRSFAKKKFQGPKQYVCLQKDKPWQPIPL